MPQEIHFILVDPAVPENVGFSLRALKTMGFGSMRMVRGCGTAQSGTHKTAYGSHDLMDKVQMYENLEAATADIDFLIGTTAKGRTLRKDVVDVKSLKQHITDKGSAIGKVAIVFGSEENGLSKEEINICDIVSTIPLATEYPSLNLAQSVLLFAWELSEVWKNQEKQQKPIEEMLYHQFRSRSNEILEILDVPRSPVLHRRVIDRLAMFREEDIYLALSLMKAIEFRLKN